MGYSLSFQRLKWFVSQVSLNIIITLKQIPSALQMLKKIHEQNIRAGFDPEFLVLGSCR
jgi:hypothetical protein